MNDTDLLETAIRNNSLGAGTIATQCSCGRTHFARGDAGCFEEGELEALEQKAEEKPDSYIGTDDSSVYLTGFAGGTCVFDCPCRWQEKYATFFWTNRATIVDFLRLKSEQLSKEAAKSAGLLSSIGDIP